jgi:hypothetical protein
VAGAGGVQIPGLDLLEEPDEGFSEVLEEIVREQAESLEEALQEYKLKGEVVGIESGPVITLYHVKLAPGTKVSKLNAISERPGALAQGGQHPDRRPTWRGGTRSASRCPTRPRRRSGSRS